MTLTSTFDLDKFTKVKIFETYQLRKTSQNMLGYYAQGIIYCWQGQAKGQIHLIGITSHLLVTETSNLVHILVYEMPHQIWPWPWPWKVHQGQNFWNIN